MSAHHRRIFGEMYKFSFAYEVILKETQPKVGLSKILGSDQKQTLNSAVRIHFTVQIIELDYLDYSFFTSQK